MHSKQTLVQLFDDHRAALEGRLVGLQKIAKL
jgi:hypothetical protein